MTDHDTELPEDELVPSGADVDKGQLIFAARCYAEVAYNITSALRYAHGDGPRQADHYEGDDRARILSMLEDIKADPVRYHYGRTADGQVKPPGAWPWDPDMWAPYPDPERNLVTARNLLDAEIARVAEVSGVPVGGGEPQPTDLVRELRDAVGLFSGAMPITPRQAWDEAIAVAKRAVHERDAYEAVRSAVGGDQPDTPCPHCKGTRVVVVPLVDPNGEPNPDLGPCPACTPSPEEGTP